MEDLADAVDLTRTSSNEEHKMLSGIVNLVNTEVEEIMRPRIDIMALDMSVDYDEVKREIIESGYSRIPVYDEDLDDIKGALYVKDLLPYINRGKDFEWQKLLRKIYFVPKHKKIDDLLRDFQENKIHIAIVVDEYGATQGLVSLEDILEEVVGEIDDRARGNYYSPWESSKLAVTVSRVIREEADWLVVLDAPFIAIDTADFQRLRDELKGRICLAANPQKPGEWDVTSLISVDFAFNAVRKMCVWRGVVPCEFGGGGVDYE